MRSANTQTRKGKEYGKVDFAIYSTAVGKHVLRVEVFRDREIDPGCRSKQEDVTAGEEVIQNNIPQAPTTHRPDQ